MHPINNKLFTLSKKNLIINLEFRNLGLKKFDIKKENSK